MKKFEFWGILGLCAMLLVCSSGCHIFPWNKGTSRNNHSEAPRFFPEDDEEQQLRELRSANGHSNTTSSKEVKNTTSPFMSDRGRGIYGHLED